MFDIKLSTSGLQRIAKFKEPDFYFIFGEKRYPVRHEVAEFLSPKILILRINDPTTDSFTFNVSGEEEYIESLIKIGTGVEIQPSSSK